MNWVVVTFMFLLVLAPFLSLAWSLAYTWVTAPETKSSEE